MSKEKLVSVIIPTYGRPKLLSRAIDSVLKQNYQNIEIFVVDDNNPNTEERRETEKLMLKYTTEKKVVYLKHDCNKNGAAARNTGLSRASGEYITFLDDDDEMLPNRISLCVDGLSKKDESWGACYTDFIKYKGDGTITSCGENRSGNLYLPALMRTLYIGSGSNLFLRTKHVKAINGYDPDFHRNQDLEFMTRFLEKNKLLYIPEKTFIVHYEDSRRSPSTLSNKQRYERLVSIDDFYIRKFSDRISKLSRKQQRQVYSVIALERFRYSIDYKMLGDSVKNCIKNHVSIYMFIKYCFYMVKRLITGKTYGFRL